ncbi:MAG: NUDIX hydrolase [Solirubrobacterales bacterium]|nr:NUDIX hydrolase [Solirubrobacterales bacterium]
MGPDDDSPEGGPLERTGGKLVYRGPIASVRMDTFVYPDGSSSSRQVVIHPGSVAILAHDGESIQMVRQPRPAVRVADLLELPAGKLDKEGETPLECAQRELAEEVGKSAGDWRFLKSFYTSPGFTSEECHLFLATELYDASTLDDPNEPIDIVEWPLDRLSEAIEQCADAASLVGLLMLEDLL